MAEGPAYTTVPGKIPQLLTKIRESGVPRKATVAWLKGLGFTSSNDATLIGVLRQIGFVDSNGAPQPAWKEYRGANHRAVLGRAITLGYESLYATYPDAHLRPNADLFHVLSTQSSAGKQAIDKSISTFKNLVKEADFEVSASTAGSNVGEVTAHNFPLAHDAGEGQGTAGIVSRQHSQSGMTINVNVELTLPETTDEKVFEAFFRAMRKHLIDDNDS